LTKNVCSCSLKVASDCEVTIYWYFGSGLLFWTTAVRALQASSVTFYTSYPVWSICFENTVLTWIVCGLLWIAAPFYFLYMWRRNVDFVQLSVATYCRRSPINIAKLVRILYYFGRNFVA